MTTTEPRPTDAVVRFLSRRSDLAPVALRDWTLSFPGERLRVGGWVVHPDGRYPVGAGVLVERLGLPGRAALANLVGDCTVQAVRDGGHYLEFTFKVDFEAPRKRVGTGEEAVLLRERVTGLEVELATTRRAVAEYVYDINSGDHLGGDDLMSRLEEAGHSLQPELDAIAKERGE